MVQSAPELPADTLASVPLGQFHPVGELTAFAGELRGAAIAELPERVESVLIDWQAVAEVRAGRRST